MFDPFQAASITMQNNKKKTNKLKKAYISSLVGMIVAVIMILPITYKICKMPYANYKNYNYS